MAKKEQPPKTVLERVYNVPLRKEFRKAPKWRRTAKAAKALKEFIAKHMKSNDVVIGRYANQQLWRHGIKNPPHHIKVNAVKDERGKVRVELVDLPGRAKREEEKQKRLEKRKEKKELKREEKKPEAKSEELKSKKEEKAKEIEKIEMEEMKKELPKSPAVKIPPQEKQVEQRPTAPKNQ